MDPEHPYLAMFRCDTNTVVRWPTNAANFQLAYSNVLPATNWISIPPPYAVLWDHYYVTNHNVNPTGFFQLRKP
jgi:hypothetical protein